MNGLKKYLSCALALVLMLAVSAIPSEVSAAVNVTGINTLVTIYVVKGKTVTLPWAVSPDNAANKAITWSSTNKSIATVTAKGVVKGVKVGKTTVTVSAKDGGKKAKCTVNVVAKATAVKSVSITRGANTSDTRQLNAKVMPSNATSAVAKWSSSNTSIAKVDKFGKVTKVKSGKVIITVTVNGKSAKCAVTFYDYDNTPSSTIAVGDYEAMETGTHVLAIKEDGGLWAWGSNEKGQLGDGTTKSHSTPVKVMNGVLGVSAHTGRSMAIKTDGSLWAWGWNYAGQIGDGTTIDRLAPVKVMDDVATVSTGSSHTMAIKTDGSLWAWGANEDGQLGDGTSMRSSYPKKIMDDVTAVSAGNQFTMAIKTDGSLWAWGRNMECELGDNDNTTEFRYSPVKIMDNVISVSAGGYYTLAVKTDGSLWAWGYNTIGNKFQATPVKIMNDVAICKDGMVIKTDGSLWTWQINVSKNPHKLIQFKMADDGVVAAAGYIVTVALKTDGSLWKLGHELAWLQLYGYPDLYQGAPVKVISGVKVK